MKERNGFLLRTVKQMNIGAGVSGVGFLLYLAASALKMQLAADMIAVVFGVISLYVFASVSAGRSKDKEAVSYNLLWGTGALALMLTACAVLTVKQRFGL